MKRKPRAPAGAEERRFGESPFVGPQPFRPEQHKLFFGRDREIHDLIAMLASSRTVLLHAESGAGKTSLLDAGLRPNMPKEFLMLPSGRVRGRAHLAHPATSAEPEKDLASPSNVFVRNYIDDLHAQLVEEHKDLEEAIPRVEEIGSLADYADLVEAALLKKNDQRTVVYVIDQFEELFTTNLHFWKHQRGFFTQARALVTRPVQRGDEEYRPRRRLLLSMRSDYVGRVEQFAHLMPEKLHARYNLERLRVSQAVEAIRKPTEVKNRRFESEAAQQLAARLAEERVQKPGPEGGAETVAGQFVEPVQLQVVCDRMWRDLPEDVTEITKEHVKTYGDVDRALRDYYKLAVEDAARSQNVSEARIRAWFDRTLIAPGGFRAQAFVDKQAGTVDGLPIAAVDYMEQTYHILRSEIRAGARWVEISHDRFVEPIRSSNQSFKGTRAQRQTKWVGVSIAAAFALTIALGVAYDSYKTANLEFEKIYANAIDDSLSLPDRISAAIQALDDRSTTRALHAAYSVIADLGSIEELRTSRLPVDSGFARLAVNADGGLMVGSLNNGKWEVDAASERDAKQAYSGPVGRTRKPPAELAWSRDGTRLAILHGDGTGQLLGPDEPVPLDTSPLRKLAFDPGGRYLASFHCAGEINAPCGGPGEIIVTNTESPIVTNTGSPNEFSVAPPAHIAIDSLALAWPRDANEPWIAVAGCDKSRIEPEPQQRTAQASTASSGDTSKSARVSQRQAGSIECREALISVRPPGGFPSKENSESASSAEKDPSKSRTEWRQWNLENPVSSLAFSIVPVRPSKDTAKLLIEERRGDSKGNELTELSLTGPADDKAVRWGPSAGDKRVAVPARYQMRGFIEIDATRLGGFHGGSIAVANRFNQSALASTVSPVPSEAVDAERSVITSVRPGYSPELKTFFVATGGGAAAIDSSGFLKPIIRSRWQQMPAEFFAQIAVSGDARFAMAFSWPSEFDPQALLWFDPRRGKLLAAHRPGETEPPHSSWREIVSDTVPATYTFVPGTQRLISLDLFGNVTVADVTADGPADTKRWLAQTADTEDEEAEMIFDFAAIPSPELAVAARGVDALVLDSSREDVLRLGLGGYGSGLRVLTVSASPGGDRIAIAGEGGLAVWRTADLESALQTDKSPPGPVLRIEEEGMIVGLAFSPDARLLYGALYEQHAIQVYDANDGSKVGKPIPVGFKKPIGLSVDPASQRMLIVGDPLPEPPDQSPGSVIHGVGMFDISINGLKRALCRAGGNTVASPRAC